MSVRGRAVCRSRLAHRPASAADAAVADARPTAVLARRAALPEARARGAADEAEAEAARRVAIRRRHAAPASDEAHGARLALAEPAAGAGAAGEAGAAVEQRRAGDV